MWLQHCTDLYVCTCGIVFKVTFITDNYGRVRMHVFMHLAFKELNASVSSVVRDGSIWGLVNVIHIQYRLYYVVPYHSYVHVVLVARHIWLLSPASSDHEWGRHQIFPYPEAKLEPYEYVSCEF